MLSSDYAYNAATENAPGFPGMLYDIGFTDKVVTPCGASAQPFGTVVGTVAATGVSVLPTGTNLEGVAIHDHMVAGRRTDQSGYVQGDAMSVLKRGRIWARASGACTKDAVAKYDPATGVFADAGTATYPQAKFLTGNISVVAIVPGGPTTQIVLVELHNPTTA